MRNNSRIITIIITTLLVVGVIFSSFLTSEGELISTIATTVTAIIGAVALFFQFKKDKEINQASFLVEFSKQFFETYDCLELFELLDNRDPNIKVYSEKKFVGQAVRYLQWCEELASLVETGILTIPYIDKFLSYRFFLITNCKEIQDFEIIPSKDYYQGIIQLHQKWTGWKRKNNLSMPFDSTNLTDILSTAQTPTK